MADDATFNRGERYFHKHYVISALHDTKTGVLRAKVKGSGKSVYSVYLSLTKHHLQARCSCPVAVDCKHGVAAALYWLHQEVADPEEAQMQWLAQKIAGKASLSDPHEQITAEIQNRQQQRQQKSPFERWLASLPSTTAATPVPIASQHHLLYFLEVTTQACYLRFQKGYLRKDGSFSQLTHFDPYAYNMGWNRPKFLQDEDIAILQLLTPERGHRYLKGDSGYLALTKLLASHRFYLGSRAIRQGEAQALSLQWQQQDDNYQLDWQLENGSACLPLGVVPPCYLDPNEARIGQLLTPIAPPLLQHLQQMPSITSDDMPKASLPLRELFTQDALPLPAEPQLTVIDNFTPHLNLSLCELPNGMRLPGLMLHFDYGLFEILPDYLEPFLPQQHREWQGENILIKRDEAAEENIYQQLLTTGLSLDELLQPLGQWSPDGDTLEAMLGNWQQVIETTLPELAAAGFIISQAPDFEFQVTHITPDIGISDHEEAGWFDFSLTLPFAVGQTLNTSRVVELWLEQNAPPTLTIYMEGEWVQIDPQPLQAIRGLLVDLFSDKRLDGTAKLASFQAAQLRDLSELDSRKAPVTQALMDKLADFTGLQPVAKPDGLNAELRGYQQQGLNWLAFLQQYGFGGILADDMGLGKTLQVLALILHLKNSGQLKKPALIVVPTSLLGNWIKEAAHFAPGLKTLLLHGGERAADFKKIPKVDLVVTSYALVSRDLKQYQQHSFSLLVLDEAQAIKNPTTKTAHSVRQINSQMRLCLTGTPMENHLGELWALMDFALPGLLGGRLAFNEHYRTPIEKDRDLTCQKSLANKVAPFMLRRSKASVATELPPKTEIIQTVELAGKQRALYEGIRLSMEKRIRDLVASQGMAKSHIAFLDALLKLRQACIDPRLVKLDKAATVKESAKLDWLADNLPQLLEEGRSLLIFSQFTEALALIEALLKKDKIAYSKLTGATRKRQEAIDRFQSGEVKVFLISLKAGGAGLNLTAADTVIHLDPWWNPAVENQATDRAYRIGQDKPVFVYKLVAEGTVEERIQLMQQQKQALASALFDETGKASLPDNKDDLLALLAAD